MNYIRFWQADGESQKTSIRTATRLHQITEDGHFTGGICPYGYKLVKLGRKNKKGVELNDLAINEDEAPVVRMIYVFDIEDGTDGKMEAFLTDYTENVQPLFDYESKATYQAEFDSMRSMFLTLGGALSFIIGLVGVLNFLNAVLTGIITRRHEFAVLQAIGMTGRQLRRMLMLEGLYYALLAMAVSTVLSVTLGPLIGAGCANVFWFFVYKFSVLPLAVLLPVFILLGLAIPLVTYRGTARQSIVERLRTDE